jgi:hypothetical protein
LLVRFGGLFAMLSILALGCGRSNTGKPRLAFVSNNAHGFWTYAERGCEKAAREFDVSPDALIQLLAEVRSEMSPPVSEEPPQVHPDALHNPRYATQLHQFSGGTLLEFRHPSLGWMDFVLPSLERQRITRFFSEQEETWQRFGR